MWEYIRVKPFPLYHEVRFKVWCCVIYTHAILPHLYHFHVFFFPKVDMSVLTVAFPLPINSHTLLSKVSINLCLQLTQINSDRQKPQHSSPSDSSSLHLTFFLFICLTSSSFLLLINSHSMSTGDIEEIIVFLSHCFLDSRDQLPQLHN